MILGAIPFDFKNESKSSPWGASLDGGEGVGTGALVRVPYL